jgi:hypothetical protein
VKDFHLLFFGSRPEPLVSSGAFTAAGLKKL